MCCLVAGCSSLPACKEQSQQRKCHYPIRINEQIPSGQARPAGRLVTPELLFIPLTIIEQQQPKTRQIIMHY